MIETISILFEDEHILVINKPYGVVVNRAESVKGTTIQDWMEDRYPELFKTLAGDDERVEVFRQRSGLAHRLDKDTSGILLLSKTPSALEALMSQFKQREVHKEYLAIVHGRFNLKESWVHVPMARIPGNRKRFGVIASGKMTETKYKVIQEFVTTKQPYQDGFSLVRFWPKTGRTHQIRVVCKHLQRPIVGDQLYVGRKRSKADAKWCNRQCLHAAHLSFTHPVTNQELTIEAPFPPDLEQVLEIIKDESF